MTPYQRDKAAREALMAILVSHGPEWIARQIAKDQWHASELCSDPWKKRWHERVADDFDGVASVTRIALGRRRYKDACAAKENAKETAP